MRMDVHGRKQDIVVVLVLIAVACSSSVSFGTVYVYDGGFNMPIPDKGRMADTVIDIKGHHIIHDLNVGINVTCPNVFDLRIFLQSPADTRVCLNTYDTFSGFFRGTNYIQTVFDDEAEVLVGPGEALFTGRFRPVEPYKLSQFDGQDVYGCRRPQIYDAFYADEGALNSYELMITNPEPATALLLVVGVCLMLFQSRHQNR